MSEMTVHAGSARDMGRRFANAFERAAHGEDFEERHFTFLSLKGMMSALTPKRLELLRHLHRGCAKHQCAALKRDYKRVYEDVATLESAGLIVRDGGRLYAPWAALAAEVTL